MILPKPLRHRLLVRALNLRVERGVGRADGDAHNRVRKLVDEDVLAEISRARIAKQVLFRAGRRIAAEAAGATIPILFVSHAGDATGFVIIGFFLWRQTKIVAPRTPSVSVLGNVGRWIRLRPY